MFCWQAASLGNVLGDISNPLLVLPLQPSSSPAVFSGERDESDVARASNVVGAGYKAFEESVLEKMRKVSNCSGLCLLNLDLIYY